MKQRVTHSITTQPMTLLFYIVLQIKLLTDLGLMGAQASKERGGKELDSLSFCVAIEELSRGCASTSLIMTIHNTLYVNLVQKWGNDKQKDIFLNDFTRGSIGCFALSEPSEFYITF